MDASARNICIVAVLVAGFVLYFAQAQQPKPVADTASAPLAGSGSTGSLSGFAAKFDQHLVAVQGGQFAPFDAASLKNVKYWAFYYSASWCPPCRAFTPKLVDFYNEFKPHHPDFELVFVNHDRDEGAMLSYMKGDAMPWPAVRFDDIEKVSANQFCGRGIPDLVLTDADGSVLSDSFSGSEYLGPYKVLDDIRARVTH